MLNNPGRSGEDGVFDPATVIGLRSDHNVLVMGNAAFLPWLTNENRNITSVKRFNEAVQHVENTNYDRVIVGREYDFSYWMNMAVAHVGLMEKRGLLIYFPKNEGAAWTFVQNLDFVFPLSRSWNSNTTFGQLIMVELMGEHIV